MESAHRIVITGHTGLAKRRVVENFRSHLIDALAVPEDSVRAYHLEDHLKEDIVSFLDRGWWDRQSTQWIRAIEDIVADIEQNPAKIILLSLHLAFLWGNRFLSPMSWLIRRRGTIQPATQVLLDDFQPTCFVTLIDDVHAAQRRIAAGASQRHLPLHLRIRELMSWRDMEMQLTDLLAAEGVLKHSPPNFAVDFPFEYSPVVAVRHSPEMLRRLIFERGTFVRVYASFPISRTRHVHKAEIDRFRKDIGEFAVVYDPLTIDEGPLLDALMGHLKLGGTREDIRTLQQHLLDTRLAKEKLSIPNDKFWPIAENRTLCGESRHDVELSADEIAEVVVHSAGKHAISRAIEHRDYRLIDQSDCLVVYRPLFGTANDSWSGGTEAERQYAFRGREFAKPVFLVHDTNDGGPYIANTFDDVCYLIEDTNLSDENVWQRVLVKLKDAINAEKATMVSRRHP